METNTLPKFCPVCKRPNSQDTLVCDFCGAVFVDLHLGDQTTRNMTSRRATDSTGHTGELNVPSKGMAFFLYGKSEPFAVLNEDVIYLGRKEKESTEVFVDLSSVDGFTQGVSRRHAMIQRLENRVEIMDLHSSNGTFLNGSRLLPEKPYELKSGTVIQLGRLKLVTIYSWIANR